MPLTPLQRQVFEVIRSNRSPDSYLYGALAIHKHDDSPRFSRDIDLCHDIAESVAKSAEIDLASLAEAGFDVEPLLQQPTFQRARVSSGDDSVLLEWVFDSAFRFFPVEADPEFGYRLHEFDIATNKILALAGRSEARDFVDAMHLHDSYLSIGTLAWAAAGKDEGLNPMMILEMAERFARYRQADLDSLSLTAPLDILTLSARWREAIAAAKQLVAALPAEQIGCAFLDQTGTPTAPIPGALDQLTHRGTVGGAWPRIAG
jgi:hypothetical protein